MTDEELTAFLRDLPFLRAAKAADRIEALINLNEALVELMDDRDAKLAKAVEANEKLTAERDEHWKSFVHWRKEADALTEQLEAARADAKEAEAYAEELEKEIELNEQEACMVEDDLIKADKEIDDLKAKLAKAVDALRQIAEQTKGVTPEPDNLQIAIGSIHSYARATLAEIEGEK
jgi:chromosome segregation ATPase